MSVEATLRDWQRNLTLFYMDENKYLYPKESQLIYEACHEVWKEFSGAFKESIIDKAMTIALIERGLSIDDQQRIDIYFKGKKIGTYIPDKIVNKIILIEIKCKPYITREDERQFWYYLKASNYKLGFLINFSPTTIEIKRRVYDTARKNNA